LTGFPGALYWRQGKAAKVRIALQENGGVKAVFTVTSKQGKRIRLTEVQWTHILQRRPVMTGQIEKMRLSVEDPDLIQYVPEDDVYYYYMTFG
jgi:hypothetical protein